MAGRRIAFIDLRNSSGDLFCSLHCVGATPQDLKDEGFVTQVQIPRGWTDCAACGERMS
ncbi:hypothetical protein LCGC14_1964810 [marine sediment metagenome]|uniref:Uncharacterized protein n=1 Tax=marine sediment metagenome TaxID=412755 RepID=A0A0F9FDW3_9ZZZZ